MILGSECSVSLWWLSRRDVVFTDRRPGPNGANADGMWPDHSCALKPKFRKECVC